MPAAARSQTRQKGFALRLALFYAALFLAVGVQLPFFPLWLGAKGLDAPSIGVVLAMPMVVRLFAIPFASHQADRREALRATLAFAAAASAAAYFVVGLMQQPLPIMVACAVAAAFYAPIMSLTDAYAFTGLSAQKRSYGPVRLWGSASFLVGMIGAGAMIDWIDARQLIWLIVGGSFVTAVAALALSPLGTKTPPVLSGSASRHLLRDPAFVAVLAGNAMIQGSHSVYYGFSALQWTAAGFDGKAVAALWALGVIAEIALFAYQSRLPGWMTPLRMILIGAGGAVLRWFAMSLGPPDLLLPVLQCLHGLSFGCAHLGTLLYVTRSAPSGHAARAQGYQSTALGLGMASGMAVSGFLYARYGSAAYAAMAFLAAAGGACALVAQRLHRGVTD
jgi:PPP family 3-phenylpropionic acid transporter